MSEFNSEHHETAPNLEELHEISPEEIAQFMGEVDEKHIDKPFVVDFGGGKESWILYDAVNSLMRDDKGEVTGRVPTVRLQSPEDPGRYFDLPTSQFMEAMLKAHEPDVEGGSPELTVENPSLDHEARRDSVVADIAGELGLPENTSLELLVRDIGQKIDALKNIGRNMDNMEEAKHMLQRGIRDSLDSGSPMVRFRAVEEFRSFLNSRAYLSIRNLIQETAQGPSRSLQHKAIAGSGSQNVEAILRMPMYMDNAFRGMDRTRTAIDLDAASRLRRALGEPWDDLRVGAKRLRTQLEERMETLQKIEAEGGHNKTSHEKIAVAVEKYRNEQVEKWAQELSGQDITPERAKEIASEMQNAVAIEAGMVDDPNSPRKWFGNRILENSGKRRADINHTGREAAQIGSQQYVTEIMTDILTGKFRVHSLIDPIEMKGNRVETGQHRVAALAMMYGDRWPEKALAMGQRIDQV